MEHKEDGTVQSGVSSIAYDQSSFASALFAHDPITDIMANNAVTVAARTRLFPGQKHLHPNHLKCSSHPNLFCQILMQLCDYKPSALDKQDAEKKWFKAAGKLANKTLTQVRNSRNTAMKAEHMRA